MKTSGHADRPQPQTDADALMEQIRSEVEQRRSPAARAAESAASRTDAATAPALSATEIMARVRAEVARRRSGEAPVVEPAGAGTAADPAAIRDYGLPRWQPAAPRLVDKPQYVLNDFLPFDDADFVDVAYQKLLRRPADPEGRQGYLDALRSGAASKVEILGLIRFSGEGRRQAVHVDGLLLPYKLHRWRHIRIVGWFLGMGMAVVRLPRLAWRLQGMEAVAAREAHELGRLLNHLEDAHNALRVELAQSVMSRVEGLRTMSARVEALQVNVESAKAALTHSDTELALQHAAVKEQLAAHEARYVEIASTLQASDTTRLRNYNATESRLAAHDAALAGLEAQTRGDQRAVRAMLDRLTVFLDASARRARQVPGEVDDEPALEEQYASFEQTFRGDREQIKRRAAHYLDTLAAADIVPGAKDVVLDLGSGRGEWLEVLAEHGYRGRGVDTNRGMLKESRDRGHDVVEADALEYLRAQPDASIAAITSMHMVEHVPHPAVIELLDEALRVLQPGGVLILETPNPENVLVGSCMFYMDPTHLHPIPPPLLQWTVQARGFESATIERLSEHRGSPELVPVPDTVSGAGQINQMIAWFTAPPDYAVFARKPRAPLHAT